MTQQIEIPMPWGFVRGQVFGRLDDQSNQTAILCLHGYLDNSNSFKPLAKCLTTESKDYYVVAIDLPGQGLSSKLGDPLLFNFKTFVLSVRKVVVYLKLKNFIFLNHSFGCTLSLMVIIFYFGLALKRYCTRQLSDHILDFTIASSFEPN